MILDALLKTKSRAVLVDILNKNGSFALSCFLIALFSLLLSSNFIVVACVVVQNVTVSLLLRSADAAQYNEAV